MEAAKYAARFVEDMKVRPGPRTSITESKMMQPFHWMGLPALVGRPVAPAAKVTDHPGEDPFPWGIMIADLRYREAATFLYQFWISKAFSSYPATNFISDWIGN
ncbi:uncharacterized protein EI90DRAFT_3011205 [Cantharellus anzutake]|uniref:uncharacterized protein n=1 Tax=Cantharellus anzutake TaxID=1750568 RepID=UPI001903C968|nr:uncharacterized protein EI90DRAFT_3011205 [Cantharellus anzutake]KAF8342703.1 hypothetical protein EI90DRAFT_3011205 [Cantharellus anzutake]